MTQQIQVLPNGTKIHLYAGSPHREDGPAVERPDGFKAWYFHGKCHRDGDLPAIIREDGSEEWHHHGQKHRITVGPDGKTLPAMVEASGYKAWYLDGLLHNEDGPAVMRPDGTVVYCLNGKGLTKAEAEKHYAL